MQCSQILEVDDERAGVFLPIGQSLVGPGVAAKLQVAHQLVFNLTSSFARHDADLGSVGVLGEKTINQVKDLIHGASVKIQSGAILTRLFSHKPRVTDQPRRVD